MKQHPNYKEMSDLIDTLAADYYARIAEGRMPLFLAHSALADPTAARMSMVQIAALAKATYLHQCSTPEEGL